MIEREFEIRIDKTDGCWNWIGTAFTNASGVSYGRFDGIGAHRVSYQLYIGKIPKGYEIDHLCRNTLCVRPNHLEAVTKQENNRRSFSPTAINLRKTHCLKGHLYDKTRNKGYRTCSQCDALMQKKWKSEHKAHCKQVRRKWYLKNQALILEQKRLRCRKKSCPKAACSDPEGAK
jgi:hypothetical protein